MSSATKTGSYLSFQVRYVSILLGEAAQLELGRARVSVRGTRSVIRLIVSVEIRILSRRNSLVVTGTFFSVLLTMIKRRLYLFSFCLGLSRSGNVIWMKILTTMLILCFFLYCVEHSKEEIRILHDH